MTREELNKQYKRRISEIIAVLEMIVAYESFDEIADAWSKAKVQIDRTLSEWDDKTFEIEEAIRS